jgi:DNA-directed RNA polymerase specialized sigma24 family protein
MIVTSQTDRCTKADYRQLFAASAEPLRWLCCTLTGNEKLSETVLDGVLEQSLKGADHVFREWMVSWARRLIIKFCIQTMRPWNSYLAQSAYPLFPMRPAAVDRDHLASLVNMPPELLQERLLALDDISRFVFVLRALEGYSRRETSLLLDIDDRACEWIYMRAAEVMEADREPAEISCPWLPRESECCFAHAGN